MAAKSEYPLYAPKVARFLQQGLITREIAKKLRKPYGTVYVWVTKVRKDPDFNSALAPGPQAKVVAPLPTTRNAKVGATFVANGDEAKAVLTSKRVSTLEDLITACNIDTDYWEVVQWDCKVWEMGRKSKVSDMSWEAGVATGSSKDDGKIFVQPLYSVAARLRKKHEATSREVADYLEQLMVSKPKRKFNYEAINRNADNTLEIMLPDLHLGRLSWGEETGDEDYDLDKAIRLMQHAIRFLVGEADDRVRKVLIPVGNDYFNSDSWRNETTKGTPQHESCRWQRSFREGVDAMLEVVEEIATLYEVDLMVIPGNHDTERSFYMGECMRHYFRGNRRVTVDNAATTRKYRQFGVTLVGYTHGDAERPKDLPMLLAHQAPEAWATSLIREWHHGHFHHEKDIDMQGVRLRYFSSLAPPSAWESKKGYVTSIRAGQAIQYDPAHGPCRQYNWFPVLEAAARQRKRKR